MRLDELAAALSAWHPVELQGDPDLEVTGVAGLANAGPRHVSFLANPRYRKELATSRAGAVICTADDRRRALESGAGQGGYAGSWLVCDNPYLCMAHALEILTADQSPPAPSGIDATAIVGPDCVFGSDVYLGPGVVVEAGVQLGDRVRVGPHCHIGEGASLGADSHLVSRVYLHAGTRVGRRCLIHPGAVIGADGFGFARDGHSWHKVAQLGSVVIGDDAEIGANTTIDRGALEDTVIGNGVKLDNQIQVAHGVRIGDNTAIAACVGISGSTIIGERCTVAGGVGFVGHLRIADDVHITGMSMVTRSIDRAGVWSGAPAIENGRWRRAVAIFNRLPDRARGRVAGGASANVNEPAVGDRKRSK